MTIKLSKTQRLALLTAFFHGRIYRADSRSKFMTKDDSQAQPTRHFFPNRTIDLLISRGLLTAGKFWGEIVLTPKGHERGLRAARRTKNVPC